MLLFLGFPWPEQPRFLSLPAQLVLLSVFVTATLTRSFWAWLSLTLLNCIVLVRTILICQGSLDALADSSVLVASPTLLTSVR